MTSFISVDFKEGEQMWRIWVTPRLESFDKGAFDGEEYNVIYKCFSKRMKDGSFGAVLLVTAERDDEERGILGQKVISSLDAATEGELVAFVKGFEAIILFEYGEDSRMDCQDFTKCDTYEKFRYMLSEGTTNRVNFSEEGGEGQATL